MAEDTKTYKANGKLYDIPSNKSEDFLVKYPDAEPMSSFVLGEDTFDIPESKAEKFLSQYPDAQPTFGVKKKDEAPASQDGGVEPLAPTSTSTQDDELEAAITTTTPETNSFLQNLSAKNAWYAAPINHLRGAVHGVGPSILNIMDGAQKAMYRGIGTAMQATGKPGLVSEGAALIAQQDEQDKLLEEYRTNPTEDGPDKRLSWWRRASLATDEYVKEKMPPKMGDVEGGSPYKKNFFSDLVHTGGEMLPMFMTLPFTPNPTIHGVGTKLAMNLGAARGMGEYGESGDVKESIKQGIMGARDGLAIHAVGLGGSKLGMGVAKALTSSIGQQAAGIAGAASSAIGMGAGGWSHSIAAQLAAGVKPEDLNYEEANQSAGIFVGFGLPGVIQAATSTYGAAPMEVIHRSRKYDLDLSKLKEEAIKAEQEAIKSTDPQVKAEKAQSSSWMHKMSDLKAVDEMIGKDPVAAKKWLDNQDMAEAERLSWEHKIDDAKYNAEYKKQQEGLQDLATAGDDLAAEKAARGPQKADQPSSEGKVSPKGEKPSEALKTTLTEKTPATKAEKNILKTGAEAFTREIQKDGETVGKITVEENPGDWRVKWVEVDAENQRQGIAEQTYRDLAKEAEAEGKVLRSDKDGKMMKGTRGLWEKLVEKGEAVKLEDGSYEMKSEPPKEAGSAPSKEMAMSVEKEGDIELKDKPSGVEASLRGRAEKRDGEAPPVEGDVPVDVKHSGWNKLMKARGIIPKGAFKAYVRSQGTLNAKSMEIENTSKDFKKTLRKEYGKTLLGKPKVPKETLEKMNDALSNMHEGGEGWEMLKEFPEPVQEQLIKMRNNVDALSREMIRLGIVEGDLAARFDENMGSYLTRTYKAHNEKTWKWENIPEETVNKAISFLKAEYPEFTEVELNGALRKWVYQQDGPMNYLKSVPLGAKNLDILKGRKDIPTELRDVLGEYKDPLYNYSTSVYRMSDLIARDKFLKQVLADGDGKYLSKDPTGNMVATIAPKGSKAMEPLSGYHTTAELAKAFSEFDKSTPFSTWFGQGYMGLNSAVKYGKTILSPQTHVRNYVSNYMLHLANGRIKSGGTAKDLFRFNYQNNKDPKFQEEISRMVELGVLRDNARAGEIFESIRDSYKDFNDMEKATDTFFSKPLKKAGKSAVDLYQIEDDVHKMYAYGVEKSRYEGVYRKQNPKASPEEITKMAEERAAEITRNTMPTYSLVPEAVKQVRKLPLVGTFVSFPAEIMRTTWNSIDLALKEMKDPATASIGAKRLGGMLSAATITAGMSAAAKYRVGMNRHDEDDLRRFIPSWSENSDLLFIKRPEDGKYTYIDLGYSDPLNYIKKGVNAYINNAENPGEAMIVAIGEFVSPFLDEELLASKLIDVRRNTKGENGGRIYNPEEPTGDQSVDILHYLWDGVKPGVISSADRIVKGAKKKMVGGREYDLGEELAAVGTGQRISKVNVSESFMFKTKRYSKALNDAQFIYRKVLNSQDPDTTDEDRQAAYERANEALERIITEASKDYQAARRLGVSDRTLREHMRNMYGVDKKVKSMIMRGMYRPMDVRTGRW